MFLFPQVLSSFHITRLSLEAKSRLLYNEGSCNFGYKVTKSKKKTLELYKSLLLTLRRSW